MYNIYFLDEEEIFEWLDDIILLTPWLDLKLK